MSLYGVREYVKIMRPIPDSWPKDIYGIPFVKKSRIDISELNNGKWLIGLQNAKSNDRNCENKIVHCFRYDRDLARFYNDPYRFVESCSKYYAASTLDFSMHPGMQESQIINSTFKNRWSGFWLQSNGYENVIVTVGWVDDKSYDICFAGIENGSLLIISTLGVKNEKCRLGFMDGYEELRRRFPDSQIICVGERLPGMADDICYVHYEESFGTLDKRNGWWQPAFFNWDLTEAKLWHREDL